MTRHVDVDRDMFEPIGQVADRVVRGVRGERTWDGKPISEPGIWRKVPMAEYHGQLTVGPSISSSGLRLIEAKSPLHYWDQSYLNPNRAEDEDEENAAMILGRAAHTLLLSEEGFRSDYVVRPESYEDDAGKWKPWSGNANVCKQWLADRKAEGKTVLLKSQVEAIHGIAEQLARNTVAADLLRGRIERSIVCLDKAGVWVKSRPDSIPADTIIADLKTCADASRRGCERSIMDKGYLQQMALAVTCLEQVGASRIDEAVLLFVETKRPYAINIKPLDNGDLYTAMRLNRRAIDTFAECIRTNDWPTFEDSMRTWSAPQWWADRHEKDNTLPQIKGKAA